MRAKASNLLSLSGKSKTNADENGVKHENDELTVRLLSNVQDILLNMDQEGMSYVMEQDAINICVSPTNCSRKSSYRAPRINSGEMGTNKTD